MVFIVGLSYLGFRAIQIALINRTKTGASLVVQWLRIRLPMQGTRVQALVWEDPTSCRATMPVHHNYRACAPQLLSPSATTTEAHTSRAFALQQEKPLQ